MELLRERPTPAQEITLERRSLTALLSLLQPIDRWNVHERPRRPSEEEDREACVPHGRVVERKVHPRAVGPLPLENDRGPFGIPLVAPQLLLCREHTHSLGGIALGEVDALVI